MPSKIKSKYNLCQSGFKEFFFFAFTAFVLKSFVQGISIAIMLISPVTSIYIRLADKNCAFSPDVFLNSKNEETFPKNLTAKRERGIEIINAKTVKLPL